VGAELPLVVPVGVFVCVLVGRVEDPPDVILLEQVSSECSKTLTSD
jgi:hypothetical protein